MWLVEDERQKDWKGSHGALGWKIGRERMETIPGEGENLGGVKLQGRVSWLREIKRVT